MVLVAEVAVVEFVERTRQAVREEVYEAAANILESARASPWEALTPECASAQRLPESLAQSLVDGQLKVSVTTENTRPNPWKRVAVRKSTGSSESALPAPGVALTGWFAARSATPTEGKK